MNELAPMVPIDKEHNNPLELETGLFNASSDDLTRTEATLLTQEFQESGEKGTVLYQDVFSFDTAALIELGIYDPKQDVLNRKPLIEATRKAVHVLFEKEKLYHSGFWVAEIHYNTKHFHVHVATTELQNTRPLRNVINKETGELVKRINGVRKSNTLNSMKTTFINSLLDRSKSLERISTLRNNLVKFLREETELKSTFQSLVQLKQELTAGKKWAYKRLTKDQRSVVDNLVAFYMKDNDSYHEYRELIQAEGHYRNSLYTKDTEKNDYAKHQLVEIKTRLGNALLKNLKATDFSQGELPVTPPADKLPMKEVPSNLEKYSAGNQKKILDAFPNAIEVRTANEWRASKRDILPNVSPIEILRPVKDEQTNKVVGYEPLQVFDISQTTELIENDRKKIATSLDLSSFENNLDKYSKNNRQTILEALPSATYVRTENEWLSEGRFLNDKVKPIVILRPVTVDQTKKLLGFEPLHVYDISQTYAATYSTHEVDETNNIGSYSKPNQAQIFRQLPEASIVRSNYGWLAKNREILPDAQPILISRPVFDDNREFKGYEVFEVYDISQTKEGERRAFNTDRIQKERGVTYPSGALLVFDEPSTGRRPNMKPNIDLFSSANQARMFKTVENPTTIHDEISWLKRGCVINPGELGTPIFLPIMDESGKKVMDYKEVMYFDVSQVSIASKRQVTVIKQYLKENGEKFGLQSSSDESTYHRRTRYARSFISSLNRSMKNVLNTDWERQQQLREHERFEEHIRYKKRAIEQGYDV